MKFAGIEEAFIAPSVTFTGGLGYLSTDWTRLGNSETDTFSFTPRIQWAAFNLGRVNAQIDAADARTQMRIAELAQSDMQVLQNLIAVYKSLGGGWELADASAVARQ